MSSEYWRDDYERQREACATSIGQQIRPATTLPLPLAAQAVVGIDIVHYALSDHVHTHGDLAGGSLHALVSQTLAGFAPPWLNAGAFYVLSVVNDVPQWVHISATGSGDVIGPNVSTIGNIVTWNSTDGTFTSDSGVSVSQIPTLAQSQALVGTSGTPGTGNAFVTSSDSRLTNARTPTSHGSSHLQAGSDPIPLSTNASDGLMPHLAGSAGQVLTDNGDGTSSFQAPHSGGGNKVLGVNCNFGSQVGFEETEASTTVTGLTWVTSASVVIAVLSPNQTGGETQEDGYIQDIFAVVANLVPGVGFDVIASAPGGAQGNFTFDCLGVA